MIYQSFDPSMHADTDDEPKGTECSVSSGTLLNGDTVSLKGFWGVPFCILRDCDLESHAAKVSHVAGHPKVIVIAIG